MLKLILTSLSLSLLTLNNSNANSFLDIHPLSTGRTITVEGDMRESITIWDSYGPSDEHLRPIWMLSRAPQLENGTLILDPAKRAWKSGPTHQQWKCAQYSSEGNQYWREVKGRGSCFEDLYNGRDKSHDRFLKDLNYDTSFEITLSVGSLDHFELLAFLRDEASALARQRINEFFRNNAESFSQLIDMKQKELDSNPDNYRLKRQIKIGRRILRFGWSNGVDNDETFAAELKAGHGIDLPKLERHFETPLSHPLIVVHPSYGGNTLKGPIDELIRAFKNTRRPVVYLMRGMTRMRKPGNFKYFFRDSDFDLVFTPDDRWPTVALFSHIGEHSIRVPSKDVTIIGANYGQCHLEAIIDAMEGHFTLNNTPFRIHLPLESIGIQEGISEPDNLLDLYFKNLNMEEAIDQAIKGQLNTLFLPYYMNRYQYSFYFNNNLVHQTGQGAHIVQVMFWQQSDFIKRVMPVLSQ